MHSSQVKATLLYRTNIIVDRDTIQKQWLDNPIGNGSTSKLVRIVIINLCIEKVDMKVVNVLWMLGALVVLIVNLPVVLIVNLSRRTVLKHQRGTNDTTRET
jgi:hypothetical protein